MRDNSRSSFYNYSAQSPESPWPIQITPRRFHSNKIGFLPDKDRTEVTASVCFPFSPRDLPTGQTLLCNQHQKYDILKGSHQEHNITSAKLIRYTTLHSFLLLFSPVCSLPFSQFFLLPKNLNMCHLFKVNQGLEKSGTISMYNDQKSMKHTKCSF